MAKLREIGNYLLVFAVMFIYTAALLLSILITTGWNILRRALVLLGGLIKTALQRISG